MRTRAPATFSIWVALLGLAVADYPRDLTIFNTSPILVYFPYSDGVDPGKGWMMRVHDKGPEKPGEVADGVTKQYTQLLDGPPSVGLAFYGTGVTMYGTTDATWVVYLDNPTDEVGFNTNQGDVLYQNTSLVLGRHWINGAGAFGLSHGQYLEFASVVIHTSSPEPLKTVTYSPTSDAIKYEGNWTFESAGGTTVMRTSEFFARATLRFSNARAIRINGPTDTRSWTYDITVDSQSHTPARDVAFNGSTLWTVKQNMLFYLDNIDPSTEHIISISNLGTSQYSFALSGFEVMEIDHDAMSASATSSTSSSSTATDSVEPTRSASSENTPAPGVYAGIGVGVGAALLAIGIFAFFFIRRRQRARHEPRAEQFFSPSVSSAALPPTAPLVHQRSPDMASVSHPIGSMYEPDPYTPSLEHRAAAWDRKGRRPEGLLTSGAAAPVMPGLPGLPQGSVTGSSSHGGGPGVTDLGTSPPPYYSTAGH
ncbi:hypothetical protein BKA62DRAFT_680551 [Auriculariales sp. MPI-PUGE-AT-0066]|nr:hypothetical protein BKA62DRAFT_680551 [Auriculariales sp. MPI-PUGE-AT-0066]